MAHSHSTGSCSGTALIGCHRPTEKCAGCISLRWQGTSSLRQFTLADGRAGFNTGCPLRLSGVDMSRCLCCLRGVKVLRGVLREARVITF